MIAAVIQQLEPTARLPERLDLLLPLYRRALAGKRLLLLLDNARDTAQLKDLAPPEPVALLVTSRRKLALPGAPRIDLEEMDKAEALALLRRIVEADTGSDEELATLAKTCGWLPLALRAAGSYLAVYGIPMADYLKNIAAARLDALARYGADDPELDVRAVLATSFDQLHREDVVLAGHFAMLAVFPAGFDAEATAAVWQVQPGSAHEPLGRLYARSLVEREVENRFRLHDLIRDLAVERLAAAAREEAQARHAQHYCKVLEYANQLYVKGRDNVLAGLRVFDAERTNIEAGQAWAAARWEERNDAAQLASAYTNFADQLLFLRLHPRERVRWLEVTLAACQRVGNRQGEGNALDNLALAWHGLGEPQKTIHHHKQRLAIARKIGDRRGEGEALGGIGVACYVLGRFRRAIVFHEEHLAIARETGDWRGESIALLNLGRAWRKLGDLPKALNLCRENLVICRKVGHRRGEAEALGNMGTMLADLGRLEEAVDLCEQSLSIAQEMGDQRSEGMTLQSLGRIWYSRGDVEKGIEFCKQALRILRDLESPFGRRTEAWLRERGVDPDAVE